MGSFNLSALGRSAKTAARSVIEAAVAGGVVLGCAGVIWSGPDERQGLIIGGAAAWALSSLSVTWLLAAKATGSLKAFWWAFGGGMALRLAGLAALMAYGYDRAGLSLPALLLSYAFGVLFFLLLESRHIKIK